MNLEFNKIAASILLAGLIAMVAGTAAKIFYGNQPTHGSHEEKRGYKIEGVEAAVGATAVAIDIPTLLAAGDATKGATIANKCMTCHTFEKGEANKIGPNLWAILGAKTAHMEGFAYSSALAGMKGVWNYEEIWGFINNPAKYLKGTKMSFAGIKKPEELADLIAFLRTKHDNAPALPAIKAPEAKADEAKEEKAEEVKKAN